MKRRTNVPVSVMLAGILRGLFGGSVARAAVTVPHQRETKRVTAADLERINAAIAKLDRRAARNRRNRP